MYPRQLFDQASNRSIREQLFSLPDECVVHPGHDYEGRTSSTVAEERAHNPRIGGEAHEEDFVGYMRNLALPHPKQLAIALPTNVSAKCPQTNRSWRYVKQVNVRAWQASS